MCIREKMKERDRESGRDRESEHREVEELDGEVLEVVEAQAEVREVDQAAHRLVQELQPVSVQI